MTAQRGYGIPYARHGSFLWSVASRLSASAPLGAVLLFVYTHMVAPSRVSPSSDTPPTGTIVSMTTIVGIEGIDYALFVADSQITEDNLVTLATSTPKIVEVGKYLLGISGDTRPGDILAYNWKPPVYKGENPVMFMGRKVIPSIITAFNDSSYDYSKADKDGGFDYLLSFNGNIFRVACDLSFFQSSLGLYGIGSGGQFALGYLYGVRKNDVEITYAKRHARKAVEIASVLDANTGKPLQFVIQERI